MRAPAQQLRPVEPDRVHHALDRRVQIGVGEHDERRLSAQLQRQALARPGGLASDRLADLGRAGEGHLVDTVVPDDGATGLCVTRDDIDHARGRLTSAQISAKASAVSGVYSAGFRTTVFPAASAGAIFHESISSGKFHGMIWPQTP